MNVNDVVQFNEKHEWCGCLGIIREKKTCGDDVKYMIGVQVPVKGVAFIYSMESDEEIEYIGKALLVFNNEK